MAAELLVPLARPGSLIFILSDFAGLTAARAGWLARLVRASELNTHLKEMNLAAAGLAVSLDTVGAAQPAKKPLNHNPDMEYRRIGLEDTFDAGQRCAVGAERQDTT